MDKYVFKLIREDERNESFRLNVEFKQYDFYLTILKKSDAWAATVQHQNIRLQAKQLEIDADEYLQKIQEYLRNTPPSVSLKFNNTEFNISCTLENNMKVIYFSYKLEKVNYSDCVEVLMEKFYTERNNLLEKYININKENDELTKSKNNYLSKLNEFIERKKADEEELFSNFVSVLNEKKRRIQHLNELLEAFKRGRSSINASLEVKKRSKKIEPVKQVKSEKKEIISESDSEGNYDTDEEKTKKSRSSADGDFNGETNQNRNDAYAIPSTSKFDLFGDNSPPRHLPKRIKSQPNVDNNSLVMPSSSKQSFKNEVLDHKSADDTPNVNFNTQELLDNI